MTLPQWVLDKIAGLPEDYTGKVQLNCVEGGVGNVNLEQSHRPPKEAHPKRIPALLPR